MYTLSYEVLEHKVQSADNIVSMRRNPLLIDMINLYSELSTLVFFDSDGR